VVSEQFSNPTAATVERLFNAVWPGLKKKLPTPWAAFEFLKWFVGSSGLAHEAQDTGLLVLDPTFHASEEPSSVSAAPVPVPIEAVLGVADDVAEELLVPGAE
jgi:hypothetical protein